MKNKLQNIGDIARLINSTSQLDKVFELITVGLCQHSFWSGASILAVDEQARLSRLVQRYDPYLKEDTIAPTEWSLDVSPLLEIKLGGEPLIIFQAQKQNDYPTYRADAIRRGYQTVVILPLNIQDDLHRSLFLNVQSQQKTAIDEEELIFLKIVADLAAVAVTRSRQMEIENLARTRIERIINRYAVLMRMALRDGHLEAIFAKLAALFSFPTVVYDLMADAWIVSSHHLPDGITTSAWQDFIRQQLPFSSFDDIERISSEPQSSHLSLTIPKDWVHSFNRRTLPVLLYCLEVDGEKVGVLGLLTPIDSLDKIDQILIRMSMLVLGVVLLRQHLRITSSIDTYDSIYERLFAQDWRDVELLKIRALRVGINLNQAARLLIIRPHPSPAIKTDEQVSSRPVYQQQAIHRLTERLFDVYVTLAVDDDFLIVVPDVGKFIEKWQQEQKQWLHHLTQFFDKTPIVVMSEPCQDLKDYSREWENCHRIAQLAQSSGLVGLIKEDDIGSCSLLLSIADHRMVQRYLIAQIYPVIKYDKQRGSDYLQTLKAFVECEGGYKATAAQLNIHVTTLRYRLQRIEELFNIDVSQQANRFDLQLAIRLCTLKEKENL